MMLAKDDRELETLRRHNVAVRENLDSIVAIKQAIWDDHIPAAVECWLELDDATMMALWISTTRGGIFTTLERSVMKSDEWGAEVRRQKA